MAFKLTPKNSINWAHSLACFSGSQPYKPSSILTRVKKAIDAFAVTLSLSVPLKERRIDMHMWLKPIPMVPITASLVSACSRRLNPTHRDLLIGFLRPIRSRNRAGTRDPTAKARLIQPPPTSARFLVKPTLVSSTTAM